MSRELERSDQRGRIEQRVGSRSHRVRLVLDHASRLPNYGSKMGIDATRKWPSEGFNRPWPDEILMDEKTKALVDKKWKELGID